MSSSRGAGLTLLYWIYEIQAQIQTTATFALANLEKFCQGNVVKIGEILDKIGKPRNFEEVPVSAPGRYQNEIFKVL